MNRFVLISKHADGHHPKALVSCSFEWGKIKDFTFEDSDLDKDPTYAPQKFLIEVIFRQMLKEGHNRPDIGYYIIDTEKKYE